MNTMVWHPKKVESTRMWQFMRFAEKKARKTFKDYQQLHQWSIQDPTLFWQSIKEFFKIKFTTSETQVFVPGQRMIDARWFSGATFNFAEQLLSRDDDHPAIVSLLENDQREILSYHTLKQQVALCAAGLKALGIQQGDCVAAVLPNVSYTIIAFLACASLGIIWSSCATDFGAQTIIDRLGQIKPKLLFTSNAHPYQGKIHEDINKTLQLLDAIPSIKQIIVCPVLPSVSTQKQHPALKSWESFISSSSKHTDSTGFNSVKNHKKASSQKNTDLTFNQLPFNHPLYVLFSSGTTGQPKCIVHGAGGSLLQHIKELGLHTNIQSQDNLLFFTTCGWMMWNWMVSVLALGATLTIYDGAPTYPDAKCLFQIIEDEQITVFGTSAKLLSTVEQADIQPNTYFKMKALKTILTTGSPLLPKHYDYVYQHIKPDVQLSSISGGTDIVSCFALGNPLLPIYRGEIQCLGLGMAVNIVDEQGKALQQERGELVCTHPFPSMPVCFWNDPDNQKYLAAYFDRSPNIWAHGDFAKITKHFGLIIYGRSDTVLNPGGVRIGTAEIYRQVEKISDVVESVVIGQDWQDDIRIVLFVQLKKGLRLTDLLKTKIGQTIRENASPRHVPAVILQVPDIPRTISGKVVELAVREAVHGRPVINQNALANPEALAYFKPEFIR